MNLFGIYFCKTTIDRETVAGETLQNMNCRRWMDTLLRNFGPQFPNDEASHPKRSYVETMT